MLIGVSIHLSPQSPLEELEQARTIWTSHEYVDYQMRVGFGSFGHVGVIQITVRDDNVTQILQSPSGVNFSQPLDMETWIPITEEPGWYQTNFGRIFPETLSSYTVNELFDFAAAKLRNEPTPPVIAWCGLPDDQRGRFRYEARFNDD